MKIQVNGVSRQTEDILNLEALIKLATGSAASSGVAVALNGELISRNSWGSTALSEGDSVEILQAVAGG